jgi:hypothetical protein
MKWLVTTEQKVDQAALDKVLTAAGARLVDDQKSVPLGEEKVWEAEGPPNLDSKLAGAEQIKEIFPSSEMTLY